MPIVKPGLWNVQRDLVAPEWRWAWDDAKVILPLWEGGGVPRHLTKGIANDITLVGTAGWEPNRHGIGIDSGNGATGAIVFGTDISFAAAEPYTLAFFLALNEDSTDDVIPAVYRSDTNSYWFIRRGTGVASPTQIWYRHNGSDLTQTGFALPADEWHAPVFTWDGATVRGYLDGEERHSLSISTGVDWTIPELCRNWGTSAEFVAGDFGTFIASGRAWTAAEVRQWSYDPFGPFRLNDEIFGRVAAVGGATPKGSLGHPFHGPFAGPVN